MKAIERYLPLVEETIRGLAPGDALLDEPARYALDGGKRLRPCLLLLAADSCGGDWTRLGPAAAALECIHAYSLIHDDLPAMDDDDLRHGKPSLHRAYGEAQAILTGDGLVTLAFELLARPIDGLAPGLQLQAIAEVAVGAGFGRGMVGGQALDLLGAAQLDDWLRVAAAKTGHPLGAAAAAGALLVGRGELRAALRRYGQELGIAFQIKDDLLDVLGTEAAMGKRLRKDAAKERPNIATLVGVEAAEQELQAHSAAALAALDATGIAGEHLRLLVSELVARSH